MNLAIMNTAFVLITSAFSNVLTGAHPGNGEEGDN